MSFDLMVFQTDAVPQECPAFVQWYARESSGWTGYLDEPTNTTPALRAWFHDMQSAGWPAMNGTYATDDYDNDQVAGYTIGPVAIYADFRWSEAEAAARQSLELAQRHRLGFYDLSATEDVWLPEAGGGYRVLQCGRR